MDAIRKTTATNVEKIFEECRNYSTEDGSVYVDAGGTEYSTKPGCTPLIFRLENLILDMKLFVDPLYLHSV